MYFKSFITLLAVTSNAFLGVWLILILFYNQKIQKIKTNPSNMISVLVFLLLIVCIFISIFLSGFESSSISFLVAFILSFCFLWMINSILNFNNLKIILSVLNIYFICVTLINNILGSDVTQTSGLFLDRNYFSGFFGLCLLSIFFVIFDLKSFSLKKIFLIIIMLIGFYCLFQIQSRTSVFALVFLITLYLTFTKFLKMWVFIFIISFIGIVYFSAFGFNIESRYINGGTAEDSNNFRVVLFLTAFEIFKDNFYFGVGPNLFREHSLILINSQLSEFGLPGLENGLVAHSSYMQALAELGFFFSVLIFFQITFACFLLFRRMEWQKLMIFFYICIISITMEYLSSPIFISAVFANLFFTKSNRHRI